MALYIFEEKMAKMDPASIDKTAFECLKQYFMFANKLQGKIEISGKFASNYEILDPDLDGFDSIWEV